MDRFAGSRILRRLRRRPLEYFRAWRHIIILLKYRRLAFVTRMLRWMHSICVHQLFFRLRSHAIASTSARLLQQMVNVRYLRSTYNRWSTCVKKIAQRKWLISRLNQIHRKSFLVGAFKTWRAGEIFASSVYFKNLRLREREILRAWVLVSKSMIKWRKFSCASVMRAWWKHVKRKKKLHYVLQRRRSASSFLRTRFAMTSFLFPLLNFLNASWLGKRSRQTTQNLIADCFAAWRNCMSKPINSFANVKYPFQFARSHCEYRFNPRHKFELPQSQSTSRSSGPLVALKWNGKPNLGNGKDIFPPSKNGSNEGVDFSLIQTADFIPSEVVRSRVVLKSWQQQILDARLVK